MPLPPPARDVRADAAAPVAPLQPVGLLVQKVGEGPAARLVHGLPVERALRTDVQAEPAVGRAGVISNHPIGLRLGISQHRGELDHAAESLRDEEGVPGQGPEPGEPAGVAQGEDKPGTVTYFSILCYTINR